MAALSSHSVAMVRVPTAAPDVLFPWPPAQRPRRPCCPHVLGPPPPTGCSLGLSGRACCCPRAAHRGPHLAHWCMSCSPGEDRARPRTPPSLSPPPGQAVQGSEEGASGDERRRSCLLGRGRCRAHVRVSGGVRCPPLGPPSCAWPGPSALPTLTEAPSRCRSRLRRPTGACPPRAVPS